MRKLLRFLLTLMRHKNPDDEGCRNYWQTEYRTMTQNICAVLRLAQEPVARENVMAFAASMPLRESDLQCRTWRDKYCFRCLEKAHDRTKGTRRHKQLIDLNWYFAHDFVNFSEFKKELLMNHLLGVLDGLSLDGPSGFYQRLARINPHSANN